MTQSPENPVPVFSFWHPASLVSTFFGIGKIRFAPGTFGSLAAFPLLYLMGAIAVSLPIIKTNYEVYSRLATLLGLLLAFTVLLFIIGVWASSVYVHHTEKEDPGEVVIDEVVGQALTFILIFPSILMIKDSTLMFFVTVLGSFLLFRFFDIIKPWPIDWCDKHIKGGIGIMFDDIVAAIMAVVLYYALFFFAVDASGWFK